MLEMKLIMLHVSVAYRMRLLLLLLTSVFFELLLVVINGMTDP
jgi:hypothetical protein